MAKIESDKRALDINTLFRRLSDARSQWDGTARQDLDFYLGNHFSSDEKRELQSRNQADITVDRIYPAIGDQLDNLYKDILSGKVDATGEFAKAIKVVKDAHPKA